MNTNWSYRADMLPDDIGPLFGMVHVNPVAGRILLTGEVEISSFGELNCHGVMAVNDMVPSPLFVFTDVYTVRMLRFNSQQLWPLVKDYFQRHVDLELDRMGVHGSVQVVEDFYFSVFKHLKMQDSYAPSYAPEKMYLNALTFFGKPLFEDIHASEFFAVQDMRDLILGRFVITPKLRRKADATWNRDTTRLTNAELEFLYELLQ